MSVPVKQEVKIIQLVGHVRMGPSLDELRSHVDGNLATGHVRMVVGMAGVRALDSSAIGVLVRSLSLAKQRGGTIKLAAIPHQAKISLQTTGVLRLFEVFEDDAAAMNSFSS